MYRVTENKESSLTYRLSLQYRLSLHSFYKDSILHDNRRNLTFANIL